MRNILILSIILCLYLTSCSRNQTNASTIKVTDSGTINNSYLELTDSAGFSLLKIDGKEIKGLHLKPPCYFIKRNGKIQYFAYPEVEVNNAVILAGQMEVANMSIHPSCGNATQGLLLKKDTILLINRKVEESYTCPNQSLDEKEFWSVAHYENK